MNPFFAYLIKSSLSLVMLYGLFRLTMRNDRNHSLNRFLLLGIVMVSAVIPFIEFPGFREEVPSIAQVEVFREYFLTPIIAEPTISEAKQPLIEPAGFMMNPWLTFYLLGIALLLVRLLFGVLRVVQIIRRGEQIRLRKIVLVLTLDFVQPFSFLNKIVLSENDYAENKDMVVAHEQVHIKKLHVIDLIVCEAFAVMHFFNPMVWLLRRDIRLIHEYQADRAVLNRGIDAKKYQLLVLEKSVGERRFAMANHFTQKPIIKRLKMMQTKNEKQWKGLKVILFIPMLILLLQAFTQPNVLVEKASELIPLVIQIDSSDVWLDNWTIENIKNISEDVVLRQEVKPSSGQRKYYSSKLIDKISNLEIPETDLLPILINSRNQILASNQAATVTEVLDGVELFLKGSPPFEQVKKGPQFAQKNLPLVGEVQVSKGAIMIQYDINTEKGFVQKLLRQIGEKFLEARQNTSKIYFGQDYFSLPTEKRNVVDQIVPVRLSIVTPKRIGVKKQ